MSGEYWNGVTVNRLWDGVCGEIIPHFKLLLSVMERLIHATKVSLFALHGGLHLERKLKKSLCVTTT